MSHSDPRRLLGSFIRTHRERLPAPTPSGGRRRTPGLRREELAAACGVGVTWITWLEQGRDVSASAATLSRLSEALQLSAAERASLFDLAGKHDPSALPILHTALPESLLALPMQFNGPAYLLDHAWNARAWNAAATGLFTGWLDEHTHDRNLLRFVFLNAQAQTLILDWHERACRLVAEFRADFNRRPRDVVLLALIEELTTQSPLFASFWQEQSVMHREGGERSFQHPQHGFQNFTQTTLLVASHPECKLVCLSPSPLLASPRPTAAP